MEKILPGVGYTRDFKVLSFNSPNEKKESG